MHPIPIPDDEFPEFSAPEDDGPLHELWYIRGDDGRPVPRIVEIGRYGQWSMVCIAVKGMEAAIGCDSGKTVREALVNLQESLRGNGTPVVTRLRVPPVPPGEK